MDLWKLDHRRSLALQLCARTGRWRSSGKATLQATSVRALLNFIHGYDAMVILPHGQKASWMLTGFPTR